MMFSSGEDGHVIDSNDIGTLEIPTDSLRTGRDAVDARLLGS